MSFRDFDVVGDLAEKIAEAFEKGRSDERADVLASLRRRQQNAEAIASRTPENDETYQLAKDRARQLAVVIETIEGGLHLGQAAVEAKLAEGLSAVAEPQAKQSHQPTPSEERALPAELAPAMATEACVSGWDVDGFEGDADRG